MPGLAQLSKTMKPRDIYAYIFVCIAVTLTSAIYENKSTIHYMYSPPLEKYV